MHVAVIGCGSIGSRHATNIKALGHSLLLFDQDTSRATAVAHSLDCGVVGGLRSLSSGGAFISDSDAVLICTPAFTHAAVARQLLEAGYRGPLFVEKPIAISVEECAIFEVWPHPTTMVGYNLRHHRLARGMRAMFRSPVSGSFAVASDMATWPGGSYAKPLLEYSHEIDLALWFGAPPQVNYADRSDDRAFIVLGGRGGWDVSVGWKSAEYRRLWSVYDGHAGFRHVFHSPKELGDQMYSDEIAHFLDCAYIGVPTGTPFTDGISVLDVIAQVEARLTV